MAPKLTGIPIYTIHDCFATTANNMALIKNNVTTLFSEMYFNKPYLKLVHIQSLIHLYNFTNIYAYPIEYEESDSPTPIIKDFKTIDIDESEIFSIDNDFINDSKNEIFENKYYLFIIINGERVLIPHFPNIINDNIINYREILRTDSAKSTYLIS